MTSAPECARCQRSEAEHQARDDDTASDIQRRIWRALGAPCARFADHLHAVFAENQGRTARRPGPGRRPAPAPPSAAPEVATRGAAAARAALGLPPKPGGTTRRDQVDTYRQGVLLLRSGACLQGMPGPPRFLPRLPGPGLAQRSKGKRDAFMGRPDGRAWQRRPSGQSR